MRLIDANAVQDKIDHEMDVCNSGLIRGELRFLKGCVNAIPTIDPDTLRAKGRWEKVYTCGGEWLWGYVCNQCKGEHGKKSSYCPNCGAKMEV